MNAVIIIPNCIPPHKNPNNPAPPIDRYCMAQLAVLDDDRFFVSDYEVSAGGVSYTIDTLKFFSDLYPRCDLRLIVGSDSLRDMHNWRDVEDYYGLAGIVGISREGEIIDMDDVKIPAALKDGLVIIEGINMPQSSTEIKKRIREKADLTGFMEANVIRYIEKNQLYI